MRKTFLLPILAVIVFFAACKKDDDKKSPGYSCASCVTTPQAKAAYDNSSAGVYKGVIVGSSGTIALFLYNDSGVVKALVAFDGQNATLTTNSLSTWSPGQAISNAVFTGTVNNQTITATFSVGANGQNPVVSVNIPGHTVTVAVYKETSASLVKNYEGTYTGDDSGIFNMAIEGNNLTIVTDGGDAVSSVLVSGKIDINFQGVIIKGEFNGDAVNGTWQNDQGEKGTWSGKRTL